MPAKEALIQSHGTCPRFTLADGREVWLTESYCLCTTGPRGVETVAGSSDTVEKLREAGVDEHKLYWIAAGMSKPWSENITNMKRGRPRKGAA